MTDKPQKAIDALHSELTDRQRATANMLRQSIEGDGEGAPPMPDDLLNEVLNDLGVEKGAGAKSAAGNSGLVARCFQLLRGRPFALVGLAAAACIVAIFAFNPVDQSDVSGVRGNGGKIVEPPVVVFVDPTPEQQSAAKENFAADHLRFSVAGETVSTERARIVIDGGKVTAYRPGDQQGFLTMDAPTDAVELIDLVTELTQEFKIEE